MITDYSDNDPYVDPVALRLANEAHDRGLMALGIDPGSKHSGRLATKTMTNIIREVLTDRKIAKYERLGYYSTEFRDARKKLAQKKAAKRQGNFDVQDGRMIYRP